MHIWFINKLMYLLASIDLKLERSIGNNFNDMLKYKVTQNQIPKFEGKKIANTSFIYLRCSVLVAGRGGLLPELCYCVPGA